MMYQSKMALAVKVPSRNKTSVAREIEDAVYLPFGCEYSLLVKNLNSVRALVRVWIDGTDVTDGCNLVINPNSSLDLERFIKNGNLKEGNKFKFIERTAGISNHRGNKIDDGLIRVEFEFEQPRPKQTLTTTWPPYPSTPWPDAYPKNSPYFLDLIARKGFGEITTYGSGIQGSTQFANGEVNIYNASAEASTELNASATNATKALRSLVKPQSEVGITVPGDVSSQQFHHAAWFPTDGVKHVMVLRVLGEVEGEPVKAPITVKTKAPCNSCGRVNKVGAKFCTECGTSLNIV